MKEHTHRLSRYGRKCREHLSRVRLSHQIALRALSRDSVEFDQELEPLVQASFGKGTQDRFHAKLRSVLNEVHLVGLKANFELFLNLVLSVIWNAHFTELVSKIPSGKSVLLREFAESLVEGDGSSGNARELIVGQIIPNYGLLELVRALRESTGIDLPGVLYAKDFHYWPQIHVAFEVRHTIEHRDGKMDRVFRDKVERVWSNSSWGQRQAIDLLQKISVDAQDIALTYDAMRHGAELLTDELVRWSSRN